MHEPTLAGLFFDRFRCIEMVDVIMTVKVERGNRNGKQGHQAATTRNGEVDAIIAPFVIADKLVNGIERSIGMEIVYNIVNGHSIHFKNVRTESNGVVVRFIIVIAEIITQARTT